MSITFYEDGHFYMSEQGIIFPLTVTGLVKWKAEKEFGVDEYANVPPKVLAKKALYGTHIHSLVEHYHKDGGFIPTSPYDIASMRAYKSMAVNLPKVIGNEVIVGFQTRLAGTIDLVYENGSLGDIKTYATVDEQAMYKLKWQLSLYHFCREYEADPNYPIVTNYLVHLPKSMKFGSYQIGMYSPAECLQLLEEYESCH